MGAPARVLIAGFGNALCGDDGAGQAVVARLAVGPLRPGVRVVACHTDSLQLGALHAGEPEIWLVDALERGAPPGTIHRLDHDEVMAIPQRHQSAHRLSLPENLRWLALAQPGLAAVRYRLWGIEPACLEAGRGLSEPVAQAVERVCEELRAGVTPRAGPRPPPA